MLIQNFLTLNAVGRLKDFVFEFLDELGQQRQ